MNLRPYHASSTEKPLRLGSPQFRSNSGYSQKTSSTPVQLNSSDAIRVELNIVLEEYKALREEILHTIDASRQITYLTFLAAGVLLTLGQALYNAKFPELFLLIQYIFFGLAWMQLRYMSLVHSLANYLRDIVEPRIRSDLLELWKDGQSQEVDRDVSSVINWDNVGGGMLRNRTKILLVPIAASTFAVPILAIALLWLPFFFLAASTSLAFSIWDIALIGVNLIVFLYTCLVGFMIEYRKL